MNRKEDIVAVRYLDPAEADIAPNECQHILQELAAEEEVYFAITNNANASRNNTGGDTSQDSSLVGEQQESAEASSQQHSCDMNKADGNTSPKEVLSPSGPGAAEISNHEYTEFVKTNSQPPVMQQSFVNSSQEEVSNDEDKSQGFCVEASSQPPVNPNHKSEFMIRDKLGTIISKTLVDGKVKKLHWKHKVTSRTSKLTQTLPKARITLPNYQIKSPAQHQRNLALARKNRELLAKRLGSQTPVLDQEDNIEQTLVMFKKEDYHSDNEEKYEIKIDPSATAGHQSFDQDLGNNPTENDNVNVDAQLKTPVNTQIDSSTSVVSDSSHVGKTPGQDQEDNVEKPLVTFKQEDYHSDNEEDYEIKMDLSAMAGQDLGNNSTENVAVKVDAQVTTPVNTQTDDSTLLLSDSSSTGKDLGNNHSGTGDVTVDAQVESQVNNKTDISTLVMSDSSFLAKSDDVTGQDIRNNHSETVAVKVDAHVEPTMNSQTDSSTLVTSDTSLLEKSHDEIGKMAEKINPLVTTPQKVNGEVEMQNTETDSTLVTSDMCSSFLAKSDNETGHTSVKQPEKINLLVTTPQKMNEQVEMQTVH